MYTWERKRGVKQDFNFNSFASMIVFVFKGFIVPSSLYI